MRIEKNLYPSLFFALILLTLGACKSNPQIWLEEDPVKQMVYCHAKRQKNLHQLELAAMTTPLEGKRERFYIHFISRNRMEIPEVRKVILDTTESFLKCANENESLKQVLRDRPLAVEELIVNIGFLKIDGSFQDPPSIAYASVRDGCIHYCYYDDLFGKFTGYEDVKEPFEMAKRMVK